MPQIDIDGAASRISADNIRGQSGSTITIVSGHSLSGSGASLTALNATQLTSGTVPDARFPATLPAASGVNLTALNATNLGSGTVPTARLGSGTANNGVFLRGDGTWAAAGSPSITDNGDATAITIDSSERVGIGTASPAQLLHLAGTSPTIRLDSATTGDDPKLQLTRQGNTQLRGEVYYDSDQGVFMMENLYDSGGADIVFRTRVGGTAVEGLRIKGDGYVTAPKQPSFLACLTSRNSNVTGAGAGYSTPGKTFTDIYDVGSNFVDGRFTAPVAGKYILYGSLYFINTASNMNQTIIYAITSNRTYNAQRSHGYNIYPYQGNFSFSVVADMDASDTFSITANMYGGSSNQTHVESSGTPQNGTFMGGILVG